ncbi:hypothetical protein VP01_3087g6 [Puccinia sorghi]|uniref:Uncharacterized protein n=1 Tax=Puccinia sorghi TaxID=27349 RepID=A0A0L6UZM7_9BASI|nr:hypothetical protein VP01_3087g6 [Puccinia sorghi]
MDEFCKLNIVRQRFSDEYLPQQNGKKSPYKLFKGSSVPLEFFKPIGNPVAVLSNLKKSKLEPRGDFVRLVGLNVELKSYHIRLDDGRFVNSKSVKFLDFDTKTSALPDYGELLIEEKQQPQSKPIAPEDENEKEGEGSVKQEELDSLEQLFTSAEGNNSSEDDEDIADLLIPDAPVGVMKLMMS